MMLQRALQISEIYLQKKKDKDTVPVLYLII